MVTTSQLRAARAMIGLSLDGLADAAGISSSELRALEASSGAADTELAAKLKRVLESHGIIFVGAGEQDASGPGVRLHQQPADEGIRPQNLNATKDD